MESIQVFNESRGRAQETMHKQPSPKTPNSKCRLVIAAFLEMGMDDSFSSAPLNSSVSSFDEFNDYQKRTSSFSAPLNSTADDDVDTTSEKVDLVLTNDDGNDNGNDNCNGVQEPLGNNKVHKKGQEDKSLNKADPYNSEVLYQILRARE
jgi:hypothetical protein